MTDHETPTATQAAPGTPAWPGRDGTRGLALLLVAAAVARAAWVLCADLRGVSFRTTDDAYYYFQVALNVTHGHGWTFDGLHPTNGFHPLWMAMILPVFALAGRDPALALRGVQVLATVVAALAIAAAWWGVRRMAGGRAALVVALAAVQPYAVYPLLNGLETGVLVLSLFLLIGVGTRRDLLAPRAGARADALLGALLGLTFLARLDSVFLVPSLAVVAVLRALSAERTGSALVLSLRKLAVTGAVFAAVCAPYLLWNHVNFHHFVPISGALKSTFPHVSFTPGRLQGVHTLYGMILLGGTTVLLAGLAFVRRRAKAGPAAWSDSALAFCWAMWGGNVLHFAYSLAFVDWGAQWWHYVAYLPTLLTAGALAFAEIDRRTGWRRVTISATVTAAAVVFAASLAGEHVQRGETRARWYDAMVWERDHLPRSAVLAMTDCGFVGYFGGHPIVNLDGLINGYEYQDALREHRLAAYLRASGVTYVGNHRARYEHGVCVIDLPARLVHRKGSAIVCTPGAEVYRSPAEFPDQPRHPERGMVRFILWDLSRVRIVDDADAPLDSLPAPVQGRAGGS